MVEMHTCTSGIFLFCVLTDLESPTRGAVHSRNSPGAAYKTRSQPIRAHESDDIAELAKPPYNADSQPQPFSLVRRHAMRLRYVATLCHYTVSFRYAMLSH